MPETVMPKKVKLNSYPFSSYLGTSLKGFAVVTEVPSQLTLKYEDYPAGPDPIR